MIKMICAIIILLASLYLVLVELRADEPNNSGIYICPECGTVFVDGWKGRTCPEDSSILLYSGYDSWDEYKKSKS